jgi:hypothetical protein
MRAQENKEENCIEFCPLAYLHKLMWEFCFGVWTKCLPARFQELQFHHKKLEL